MLDADRRPLPPPARRPLALRAAQSIGDASRLVVTSIEILRQLARPRSSSGE